MSTGKGLGKTYPKADIVKAKRMVELHSQVDTLRSRYGLSDVGVSKESDQAITESHSLMREWNELFACLSPGYNTGQIEYMARL